jgi:hypothetical protein
MKSGRGDYGRLVFVDSSAPPVTRDFSGHLVCSWPVDSPGFPFQRFRFRRGQILGFPNLTAFYEPIKFSLCPDRARGMPQATVRLVGRNFMNSGRLDWRILRVDGFVEFGLWKRFHTGVELIP